MKKSDNSWTEIISGERGWFDLKLSELFNYSYLIYLFVKRDFVIFYKQTILGPLWYIILPIVNTVIFNIIFGKIAKILNIFELSQKSQKSLKNVKNTPKKY